MTWQQGRAEMLALDVPYLREITRIVSQNRVAVFAAAVAIANRDDDISDDEAAALVLLAWLLTAIRTTTADVGAQTTRLSAEVAQLAASAGFDYAASEAWRRMGVRLRYRPVGAPRYAFATAARIDAWPDVFDGIFREQFGLFWNSPTGQAMAPSMRLRQSALAAINFIYGTERDSTTGMLTRRALMTVHQTNLDTFRETAVAAWQQAPELAEDEWRWRAKLDDRTCSACIAKHGKRYPMHVIFEKLHAGCRCFPEVIPHDAPDIESGENWLARQPRERQEKVLGVGGAVLYREGEVRLTDFVRRVESEDFGTSYRHGGAAYAKRKAERREKRRNT